MSKEDKPIVVRRPVPRIFRISSPFGVVRASIDPKKAHKGTDFACPEGTPVVAAAGGQVIKAMMEKDEPNAAGNRVWIWSEGNNYTARMGYFHLQSFIVKKGQKVKEGDIIGYSGNTGRSTGPHLHFQINKYPGDTPVGCDFYDELVDPGVQGIL